MTSVQQIIFLTLVFLVLAGIAGAFFIVHGVAPNSLGGIACTLEAKQCPDGSYVGRTGPKCAFAPCPPVGSRSGITGMVLLGPTCPVVMDPPQEECADRPYATTLAITTISGERVIKEFSSNEDGRFTVSIEPGVYEIRSSAIANILPYCTSQGTFSVDAGRYTEVAVSCDSGIR